MDKLFDKHNDNAKKLEEERLMKLVRKTIQYTRSEKNRSICFANLGKR
jgi:hypothetical protein